MTATVAHLVDAKDAQRPTELPGRRLLDPALDEAHHAGPVQAELAAHAGDGAVARSPQHLGLECVREPRPGPRPRHLLDADAAVATADPAQRRSDQRRHVPAVGVAPRPGGLHVVDAPLGLAAARADRRGARRREVHDHALRLARRRGDTPALGREQLLGQDANEHPSDSFLSFHTPGRTRWGAPSPLPVRLSIRRGRAPRPRLLAAPPRAETLSRGAAGAERSELALYSVAGNVASGLSFQLSSCPSPEREKILRIGSSKNVSIP